MHVSLDNVGAKKTIVDGSVALTMTTTQASDTIITNGGQGPVDVSHTLPVASAGLNFTAIVTETQNANYWRFTANTSPTPDDYIILNGATGKTYVQCINPSLTQGAMLQCVSAQVASNGIKTGATLAIGTTPAYVANGAFTYDVNGIGYSKTATPAGTAPGNDVVPSGKFGAVAFDIGIDGTIDAIEATDNATGYNTGAYAIAGLPQEASGHIRMGYITATKSDGSFTFGTTALNAVNATVVYTSNAVYDKPYNWVCSTISGTWETD